MEHGIIHSDLLESEIKPKALLDAYRTQVEKDNAQYFQSTSLGATACPACGGQDKSQSYKKQGLVYNSCSRCLTLYVNPRPSHDQVVKFFRESKARTFWFKELWSRTLTQRHEKVHEPLFLWIETFLQEYLSGKTLSGCEVLPAHWGVLENYPSFKAVEPLYPSSAHQVSGLNERAQSFSSTEKFDVICAMGALTRAAEPRALLKWINDHLNSGGLGFITTLLSTGADLMILGENSETIIPPDHLNVLSFEGLQGLLKEFKFEIIEMSTPGVLDLQNIADALTKDDSSAPRFFKYILKTRNNSDLNQAFQDFLQGFQLSSQARLVVRKMAN